MQTSIKKDILIFLFFWIFYSLIYILFPIVPDWDWTNYKHYNAWAFLNDRMAIDFLASNSRTCINPIYDVIHYVLMLKLNNMPIVFFILSCLDTAFLFFFSYKIIDFSLKEMKDVWVKKSILIFSFLFACVAPIIILETDFSRNDVCVSAFFLCGLNLFLKNYFGDISPKRLQLLCISGALMGIALGLKLSVMSYIVSVMVLFLIFFKYVQTPIKCILYWLFGVITTFLLLDGWWLAKCYYIFKNPLFPNFNHFFRSPFANVVNHSYNDYFHLFPQNAFEYLFCPLLRGNDTVFFMEIENAFDTGFAIGYIAVICLTIILLISFFKNQILSKFDFINNKILFYLLAFVAITYVCNMSLFGTNGRYLSGIYSFFGFFTGILIYYLFKNCKNYKFFIIFNMSLILLYSWIFSSYGDIKCIRNENNEKFKFISKLIEPEDLKFEDNSTVLLLSYGTSYIAPDQNPNVKYVGFQIPDEIFNKFKNESIALDRYINAKYFPSNYSEKYTQSVLNNKNKKLYVVFLIDNLELAEIALNYYNKGSSNPVKFKNCHELKNKIFDSALWNTRTFVCEIN